MNARPEIVTLARAMEIKLAMNEKKDPKWIDIPVADLILSLEDQVEKLDKEIGKDATKVEILSRAANVANYAMFIADVCRVLNPELHAKLLTLR